MKRFLYFFALTIGKLSFAQPINGIINHYTPVIRFNPCNNTISVEDAGAFNADDTVLLIQMKGAEVDSSNTALFGTVTNYRNAGNYEFNFVKSKSGNLIELKNVVTRQYDLPDGKVQLIRVPYYQSPVVTGMLTCLPWDGNKGGVLVLNARDALTLNANIDVSERGFKGGKTINPKNNTYYCHENNYYYPNDPIKAAAKGEGIAQISDSKSYGKGAVANAGGGGLEHNSGGGGGSNSSFGGKGGDEWVTCGPPSSNGGLGGYSLIYNNISNKIFMGGGGGAGHSDNVPGFNPDGGNGGGIVFISAPIISGNGFFVKADGSRGLECTRNSEPFRCHEGMGGGGGGGSIAIQCSNVTTNLQITSLGGKGADMTGELAGKLGPGGGGGGGANLFSTTSLPVNVTTNSAGGLYGVNIDFGNDRFGATSGEAGNNYFNLDLSIDTIPFMPNIDSVRIKDSVISCLSFDFKGLAYFRNNSIQSWQWNFGDNSGATTQNTIHTYNNPGTYQVKLIATDVNGCKDSTSVDITAATVLAIPVIQVTQPSCIVPSATVNIVSPLGPDLQYSINGTTYQAATSFSNLPPGIYNLTVKNITTLCISEPLPFTITTNSTAPAAPQVNFIQPTCFNPVGTINILSPIGTNLQYSIDGTNYQSSTLFSNLVANTYTLTTKDLNTGCISSSVILNINPPIVPPSSTAIVTQPSCSNVFGSILVSQPIGASLQYSIDGSHYQPSTLFTNTSSGAYNLTVKDTVNGCVSPSMSIIIMPPLSVPSTPVFSISQPVCNNQQGGILISSPLGANLQYSLDELTYQSSLLYVNLSPGSYNLSVKDTVSGCVSAAVPFTILQGTGTPNSPTINIRHPNCIENTATIIINAPIGVNFEYSMNGIDFQSIPLFNNINPGSYTLISRDVLTGCISTGTIAEVNNVPAQPGSPTVAITHPSCTDQSGKITIVSPNNNIVYSLNGAAYQTGLSFAGLIPGAYSLEGKDTTTHCTSTAIIAIINNIPVAPQAPVVGTVVQPTCSTLNGSIEIGVPLGANFEYSLNGSPYQSSPIFEAVAPGTYNLNVRDAITNCISESSSAVIAPLPVLSIIPVAEVIVKNSCAGATGTIAFTSPLGGNYEYSVDGIHYQSSGIFEGLAQGVYFITVKDKSTGCVSAPVSMQVAINSNTVLNFLMPSAFTPNKDAINDCLGVKYWGTLSAFQFMIYNRWGQLVFISTNPGDCWDGTFKGAPAAEGNYVYYIKATTQCGTKEKKGNVLLIR